MLKKIKVQIVGIQSLNDKALIETEIDVLRGVKDISVDEKTDEAEINFDDSLISKERVLEKIKELGYKTKDDLAPLSVVKEHIYFVKGMHCASCELLIEKRLLAFRGIKSVEAKADKCEVLIEYTEEKLNTEKLNRIFKEDNYVFFDKPFEAEIPKEKNIFSAIIIAALIILGFLYLNKLGLSGLLNVSSKSSLPAFFVLGLLAGISSCAALIGGMILSMSKQWLAIYSEKMSTFKKLQPHLLFNFGRIASYVFFGAILGAVGGKLYISLQFTSFLIFAVSALMLAMAFQMLGVKAFRKFQFALPRSFTRYISDEKNFKEGYMPFMMGALTFFLPCGFTITAQGLALLSGNPVQGGLIMGLFSLGTTPALLLIGLSAVKFFSRPHLAYQFSKVAGILILFFALFNINNQLNVLGLSSFTDVKNGFSQNSKTIDNSGLAPIVNGKQILKMDALSYGYSPNYFKVKVGIPVRWEITDKGTSGCTNAVISKGLFPDSISLTPGQTSIKEFTPEKSGKYKFSCWMGMISGIIEVIDEKSSAKGYSANAQAVNSNDSDVIPSGAKGCGCGGGGAGGSCGAR